MAEHDLGVSHTAALAALRRLKRKHQIATPYRGFNVIVPPEYERLECLPPDQFVPQLMEHLNLPYYAGLLSAAQIHGAAHQQPQTFQVMIPSSRRSIVCGQIRVDFIRRHNLQKVPTEPRNTMRGTVRLSTPLATALDLAGYPRHAAGLSNVATVVAELAEALPSESFGQALDFAPVAWAQRLGYLLDAVGATEQAEALLKVVNAAPHEWTRLAPWKSKRGEYNARWRVVVNGTVEPDV
jgi:predicted transcriptional regulator of viral defense system